METPLPRLKGLRVTLRAPASEDVARRFAIGRHREVVEAYGGHFDPHASFTMADARAALAFIEAQSHAWVIDVKGYIGHVRFHDFVPRERRAALAIGIDDPAFLGKGYGTEAVRLALRHGFAQGLHRVSVRVLADNLRAIGCYRKCGFVEEGREAAYVNGVWRDDLIMGLLDREFLAETGKGRPGRADA